MTIVAPHVGLILRIQPDGTLQQMTGEIGPAGASGLGSGVICVIASFGSFQGTPIGILIKQIAALMAGTLPTPPATYTQRWVLDLAAGTINTF